MTPAERPAPRFLADVMLERLARWLRVLGVDVVSVDGAASDRQLVRVALDEGRVLLTRDRRLPLEWPVREYALIQSTAPLDQLREVIDRFEIGVPSALFTRCLLCNEPLRPATAEEIAETLHDSSGSWRLPALVRRCPRCGRLYWEGAHTRRMRAALARVVPLTREEERG